MDIITISLVSYDHFRWASTRPRNPGREYDILYDENEFLDVNLNSRVRDILNEYFQYRADTPTILTPTSYKQFKELDINKTWSQNGITDYATIVFYFRPWYQQASRDRDIWCHC